MQIESSTFYKAAAKNNSIDLDLIKNIGDSVFLEMNRLTKNPPNLILDLRGLARRFVRREKTEHVLRNLKITIADPNDFKDKEELAREIIMLEGIIDKYKDFSQKKKEKRSLRYAPKSFMESSIQQKEVQEASKDNSI